MVKSSWSPVVYGRTFDADFRFLALPAAHDARWTESYILASMSVAEQLPDQPRWLLAQTTEQRLVGVTCMARDLVGRDDPQTRDAQGRPLYLFVGYLTARLPDGGFAAGPAYPSDNDAPQQALAPFGSLYQYVRAHWTEQIPKAPEQVAASALSFDAASPSSEGSVSGEWTLNTAPEWRALWPDGAQERQALWTTGQGQTGEVSLCLGLARQRDALASPFLNATAADVAEPTRLAVAASAARAAPDRPRADGRAEARANARWSAPAESAASSDASRSYESHESHESFRSHDNQGFVALVVIAAAIAALKVLTNWWSSRNED